MPEVDEVLSEQWERVFGLSSSADDDFYSVSGESITAAEFASAVADELEASSRPDVDIVVMTSVLADGKYARVLDRLKRYLDDGIV